MSGRALMLCSVVLSFCVTAALIMGMWTVAIMGLIFNVAIFCTAHIVMAIERMKRE